MYYVVGILHASCRMKILKYLWDLETFLNAQVRFIFTFLFWAVVELLRWTKLLFIWNETVSELLSEVSVFYLPGTSLSISKLYKHIPVRRQYYSNSKRKKDEFKSVIDLLMAYGLAYHSIRIVLKHNKVKVHRARLIVQYWSMSAMICKCGSCFLQFKYVKLETKSKFSDVSHTYGLFPSKDYNDTTS